LPPKPVKVSLENLKREIKTDYLKERRLRRDRGIHS